MKNPIVKMFGSKNERELKSLMPLTRQIGSLEEEMKGLSDEQLREKTDLFRERLAQGETLDDILPEAFTLVREAARRTVDMRHFDVQIMGGIVLYQGKITEMKTGEGKTLVATLPLYLIALEGKGAHLITVNDYLAKRDATWMGPIYELLGLKVTYLYHDMPHDERMAAYDADITYGTNNEFGFDYLRDNMTDSIEGMVQRGHHYAIVDEVDSVLVDEARTPLIISGPTDSDTHLYAEVNPRITNLVSRQKSIVNRYLKEAETFLNERNTEEAGKRLLQAEKGDPKNKRLLEFKENPENIKLIQKTEFLYNQSKSISQIEEELYFVIEERGHSATLTEQGRTALSPSNPEKLILHDYTDKMAQLDYADLPKDEIFAQKEQLEKEYLEASEKLHIMNQLLKAYSLYEQDVEYVIQDGKVVIVDEFTGRLMPGRRFGEGLHQAIEAKEGVTIQRDTQTLATITIQNYFRLYSRLAGMTGTAETEAEEFLKIYNLEVIVIPTNEPVIRTDHTDRIYRTGKEKWKAIADEIEECSQKGQPVLVGTISVEKSELLAKILKRRKISHEVLNARYHEKEAQIIAKAGEQGAVTIATNMAGRGTDIKLSEGVIEHGGLHIIGTERHEARRIDNQLRGRSGRQGDPGSSRFYLSLEDDLMRLFGSAKISNVMLRMGMEEDQNIDSSLVSKAISSAQKKVENRNFEIRKHLLEYDNVMNDQRSYIYGKRMDLLRHEDIGKEIEETITDLIESKLEEYELPRSGISPSVAQDIFIWLSELTRRDVEIDIESEEGISYDDFSKQLSSWTNSALADKHAELGEDIASHVERFLALQSIDKRWKEQLYEMDGLREGVGYQAYAQKDPLIEYKFQSFNLFKDLIKNINTDIVSNLFRVRIAPTVRKPSIWRINRVQHKEYGQFSSREGFEEGPSAVQEAAPSTATALADHPDGYMQPAGYPLPQKRERHQIVTSKKVGRNEPCPCGSGKKYKYCCGS
ncbi:MAG: preprotein translocase subunit SecA [Spirochaetes bacterium]|nr:preprotein translocase subunit SecA [Spirochaetota bacterium]